jgi:hypothetical protein
MLDPMKDSIIDDVIFWLLLWGMYAAWAGYSPVHEGSEHSEPLYALVIVGFMGALYLFGGRADLRILLFNTLMSLVLVPGLLVLNIYRLLTGGYSGAWQEAGFFGSVPVFIAVQVGVLGIGVLHGRHTLKRWRAEPPGRPRWGWWILGFAVLLVLAALLVLFVRP